eukprot:TRINITY_DN2826_c0_g2_i1.p3 TRINITY_DN2826_c0_g2~~TRINITY_DN2826_c0_g2_i1.p3  ORF type:complete len:131 (-),score=23.73 TRINITY_DN2826_c0_g2_i1:548-940(-)
MPPKRSLTLAQVLNKETSLLQKRTLKRSQKKARGLRVLLSIEERSLSLMRSLFRVCPFSSNQRALKGKKHATKTSIEVEEDEDEDENNKPRKKTHGKSVTAVPDDIPQQFAMLRNGRRVLVDAAKFRTKV